MTPMLHRQGPVPDGREGEDLAELELDVTYREAKVRFVLAFWNFF
jgi:hypothetical protein